MGRMITVKGIGKVSQRPDYVEITMMLQTSDKDYEKTIETASMKLEEVNEKVREAGFDKTALKTTEFTINTSYDEVQDSNRHYRNVFKGYICQQALKISFDFDRQVLSKTLSMFSKLASHPKIDVEFTVRDSTAVSEKLLQDAAANAKRKAEILTKASGATLGKLLSIDYDWGEISVFSDTEYSFMHESGIHTDMNMPDICPDDIHVKDTATFIWELL